MGSSKLRVIKVGGSTYLWRVSHRHHVLPDNKCSELFTAYLEGAKTTPLRATFNEDEVIRIAAGVVMPAGERMSYNLNEPGMARSLIEGALAAGWKPDNSNAPFIVERGQALLAGGRSIEEQIRDVAIEAQDRISRELKRRTPEQIRGTGFDQLGLVDGLQQVEEFLRVSETTLAVEHLLYMVLEAGIPLTPNAARAIQRVCVARRMDAPRVTVEEPASVT